MPKQRVKNLLLTCLALLLMPGSAVAQSSQAFDPLSQSWPHDESDIPHDPAIFYGILENGLRYAVQRNTRPKGEVSVRFMVLAGSQNETEQTRGIAHFLEHMAFNGSKNVPEGEMVKSLERLGLAFGADTNASTSFKRTQYQLDIPDANEETIDYGLFLMRETADKLLIDPKAVERERSVITAEEARSNNNRREAARAFRNFALPDLLATKRSPIGTPATIASISPEQLRAFYDTYYRPERSLLVIVGDIDVQTIRKKIEKVFGDWANKAPAVSNPNKGFVSDSDIASGTHSDQTLTSSLYLYNARPSTETKDEKAERRRSFMRGYANAIIGRRIGKKLRSNGAPIRNANLAYRIYDTHNAAMVSISPKEDDWKSGLDFIIPEINSALQFGFQKQEYDELIATHHRRLKNAANSADRRRSKDRANAIMNSFLAGSVSTTPQYELAQFENFLSTVSLQDIETAFAKMWGDFTPKLWIQGPAAGKADQKLLLQAYAAAQDQKAIQAAKREKIEFAYQNFGSPGKVLSQSFDEEFGIENIIFENGVRLNLKKTDFENKKIHLSVTVGEGWNKFPRNNPGLARLAGSFYMGGFKDHKASELTQIFSGKSVGGSLRIGSERLSFSYATNPDDVEAQLKLWTATLTSAGYRSEWREKFLEGIESSFHTIKGTPGGVAARDLMRLWTDGDRRFGYLPKDEYMKLEIADVRAVIQPQLENGAIEIGVVGDFDKAAIIKAVSNSFAALPKRKSDFDLNLDAFKLTFPAPKNVELHHKGTDKQGSIYMAWPTDKPWSINTTRNYNIIRAILQNRMTDVIREELGLAYTSRAALRFRKNETGYGYVSASMSGDPKFLTQFEAAAKKIVSDLRSGGITQDELNRARKPLLERQERNLRENRAWLSDVTRAQTDKSAFEYRRTIRPYYEAMTPESIDDAAKQLFDTETLHIVTIRPQAKQSQQPGKTAQPTGEVISSSNAS